MSDIHHHFYMTVTSDQDKDKFRANEPNEFRVLIHSTDRLNAYHYECALVDFSYSTIKFPDNVPDRQMISIEMDKISLNEMCGNLNRTLRMTIVKSNRMQSMEKFSVPYYKRMIRWPDMVFTFTIKDIMSQRKCSLLTGTTTCTLHFRRIVH